MFIFNFLFVSNRSGFRFPAFRSQITTCSKHHELKSGLLLRYCGLILQIINIQQQQMFALFLFYHVWVNEYRAALNIACLRRRRRQLRRMHVGPYTWTIPRPAESWFDIHYNEVSNSTGILSTTITGKQEHLRHYMQYPGSEIGQAKLQI